jgi:hypothetical protein
LTHEHEGRGATVNPVKTTALMVAVAVVGGILVYAASQWFFGQPQAGQELTITGYDASSSGGLEAGDLMLLYVHNAGGGQLEVALVEVAGMVHFPDPSGGTGSFMIEGQPEMTIEAGGTQTVVVAYGGPDLETGTTVTVFVQAGDRTFSAPVIIGERTT